MKINMDTMELNTLKRNYEIYKGKDGKSLIISNKNGFELFKLTRDTIFDSWILNKVLRPNIDTEFVIGVGYWIKEINAYERLLNGTQDKK